MSKKILLKKENLKETERILVEVLEPHKWEESNQPNKVGSIVDYNGLLFEVNSIPTKTKETPLESKNYSMLMTSALLDISNKLNLNQFTLFIDSETVRVSAQEFYQSNASRWLIYSGRGFIRCNAMGVSAIGLKPAFDTLFEAIDSIQLH
ncbi:hypothetical protein [Vibrio sp. D431a]|uniref:hypothetical protein n=1 Tax=Vibrio sp. D431a TaxID=2837388 RepID=UPI0025537DD6|nr:hypothetical protein [Vibrio sp. D431a]MDK9789927.1 hypothetical protein [Vibrio sp. D431a]